MTKISAIQAIKYACILWLAYWGYHHFNGENLLAFLAGLFLISGV